jgi:hypothetical protein
MFAKSRAVEASPSCERSHDEVRADKDEVSILFRALTPNRLSDGLSLSRDSQDQGDAMTQTETQTLCFVRIAPR